MPSPGAPGPYRYMPYTSGTHYDMQQCLQRGKPVPYKLATPDGTVVHFIACGCPDYGVLNIAFKDQCLPRVSRPVLLPRRAASSDVKTG